MRPAVVTGVTLGVATDSGGDPSPSATDPQVRPAEARI